MHNLKGIHTTAILRVCFKFTLWKAGESEIYCGFTTFSIHRLGNVTELDHAWKETICCYKVECTGEGGALQAKSSPAAIEG